MSFFAKGDFNIKESWNEQKEKEKQRISTSSKEKRQKTSILMNAAKNIFETPPTHDILDDRMAKNILKKFNSEKQGIQKYPQEKELSSKLQQKLPPKQKNEDIVSSMANRLSKIQVTCANQRAQIKQKAQIIQKLKKQNEILKQFKDNPNNVLNDMKKIQEQNKALKEKVSEMETFLKTYGLKWTGNKIEGKFDKDKLKKDMEKPKYNYNLPSQIDINTIVRRINQLNMGLHQQGSSTEVYKDRDGLHKFRKAQPIPIGFYVDGIAIKGYNFFPYKSKQSLQVLSDLLDGYFPYILKAKYPNGVFLKVVDKTEQKYGIEKGDKINTFQTAQQKELKPPSKEEFLEKLPKQIIKNGKIIQVRKAIQNKFDGIKEINQNAEYYEETDNIITFKTKCQLALNNNQISENDACTLKVRTQSGKISILRLYCTQSIKEVYYWMRMIAQSKKFVVVSNFPKRQYMQDEKQNLQQLGLTPNSTLHLQSIQQNAK